LSDIIWFTGEQKFKNNFFFCQLLGLEINEARPNDKLPYRGAWLWVGSEMIHLMELPNPDPLTGRPEHGGRDRHTCIAIRDVSKLKTILDKAGNFYFTPVCQLFLIDNASMHCFRRQIFYIAVSLI
jgi:hypothetical protein